MNITINIVINIATNTVNNINESYNFIKLYNMKEEIATNRETSMEFLFIVATEKENEILIE